MSAADRYSIKEGYRPNAEALTVDAVSGSNYWTATRVRGNKSFQYDVYRYAADLVKKHDFRTVIDVGCGLGFKLGIVHRRSPGTRLIGIDQPNAVDYCKRNNDYGEWYVDDFEHPIADLADLKADLVMSSDVIEHLRDPDNLLEYMRQRVQPGGLALLSTPERDVLRGCDCDHSPNPNHVREWNFEEFEAYLSSRGAEILEHFLQYPVRLAPNRLFYRHVLKRFIAGKPVKCNQLCLIRWPDSEGKD